MRLKNIYYFSFLLVIIFTCCYIASSRYIASEIIENFEIIDDVDFYIITMRGEDRMKNIETQIEKLKEKNFNTKNVHLLDAVVGKNLDMDEMVKNGVLVPNNKPSTPYVDLSSDPEIRKREVGCYLSHMKIYETVLHGGKEGYSVVFEDDFGLDDNFLQVLDETLTKIRNIDFDFLFLGINGNLGEHIVDNIYNIPDGISSGMHGYLINNKSAAKILDKLKYIDTTIDIEIFNKGKAKELIVYRIDPLIVNYIGLRSGIQI